MSDTLPPDYKIALVWFTWGPDIAPLLRSVASTIKLYPSSPKFVMVDAFPGMPPVSKHAVNWLTKHGVMVQPTSFPRNGNLRGWICAKAISDTYSYIKRITNCKYVMKIDSDVLLLDRKWQDEFMRSGKVVGGIMDKTNRGVTGPTYILHEDAIATLAESYINDLESPYPTEEDFEMCTRIVHKYGKDVFWKEAQAFEGVSPVYPDARVGNYLKHQDNDGMMDIMARIWDEVIFPHPIVPPPFPQGQRPKPEVVLAWRLANSRLVAHRMRSLVKRREALTSKES